MTKVHCLSATQGTCEYTSIFVRTWNSNSTTTRLLSIYWIDKESFHKSSLSIAIRSATKYSDPGGNWSHNKLLFFFEIFWLHPKLARVQPQVDRSSGYANLNDSGALSLSHSGSVGEFLNFSAHLPPFTFLQIHVYTFCHLDGLLWTSNWRWLPSGITRDTAIDWSKHWWQRGGQWASH